VMANCKSCGAEIEWGKTGNNKPVPLDMPPEKRYVRMAGVYLMCDTWLSHFATCPDADEHRKKGNPV